RLHLGHTDLTDHVGKEAAHHESARLCLGDTASTQVEHLLVVEATGGGRVSRTLDLTRLDLEVRHGVRTRTVGEDEVAVELVRVSAFCRGTDQHVTDPHGPSRRSSQGALVGDPGGAARDGMVNEELVLEVLAGVREVQTEEVNRRSLASKSR